MDSPFSTMSEAAIGLHEFYTSLVSAGFTEKQAMKMVIETLRSRPEQG